MPGLADNRTRRHRMNASLLLPLIREYVKGAQVTDQELEFLLQTGKELEIDDEAVKALVSFEAEAKHGQPYRSLEHLRKLIQKIGSNGAANETELSSLVNELTEHHRLPTEASHALVDLQSLHNRKTKPGLDELAQLLKGVMKGRSIPADGQRFFVQTGQTYGHSDGMLKAYIALEEQHLAHNNFPAAAYSEFIRQAAQSDKAWVEKRLDALQRLAVELGIAKPIVDAIMTRHQFNSGNKLSYAPELVEVLAKALVRERKTESTHKKYLAYECETLEVPTELAEIFVRLEGAIESAQLGEANEQITNLTRAIKSIPGDSDAVAQSVFMAKKLKEISGAQKKREALNQIEGALMRKKEERGEAPDISMASHSPRPGRLEEHELYRLDASSDIVRKSGLYNHFEGLSWYLVIREQSRPNEAGRIVINGVERSAEQVEELVFSINGHAVAYKLRTEKGECVVYNNEKGHFFDGVGALTFSPDGSSFAYLGKKGRSWHLMHNGDISEPYRALRDLTFNPVTNALAYAYYDAKLWHVVSNDTPDEGFSASGGLNFSPDGKRLVYWAKRSGKFYAVHNGQLMAGFEGVGEFSFSKDSSLLAFLVNKERKLSVVFKGRPGPTYDIIRRLSFSSDSKMIGYMATDDDAEFVVINGTPETRYSKVNSLLFSEEGRAYAYEAIKGSKKHVVTNGTPGRAFEQVTRLTFAPKGTELAYMAYRDRAWQAIRGEEGGEQFSDISELTFSPDGESLSYLARKRGEWAGLVTNDQRTAEFPNPKHLLYSADGSELAFMSYKKEGWSFIVNGKVVSEEPFDEILQPPVYNPYKRLFYFLARRGEGVFAVSYG